MFYINDVSGSPIKFGIRNKYYHSQKQTIKLVTLRCLAQGHTADRGRTEPAPPCSNSKHGALSATTWGCPLSQRSENPQGGCDKDTLLILIKEEILLSRIEKVV
jgi:hypothetical protein